MRAHCRTILRHAVSPSHVLVVRAVWLCARSDLKPENFLFDRPGPEGVLKVTDFGLSCGIQTPETIITEVHHPPSHPCW